MNDSFRADHERLARKAADFTGLAERASSIATELTAALDSCGRCWGDDEIGRSFDAAHSGSAGDTVAGIGGLPGRLGEVGARLTAMADGYRAADRSATEGVERAGA